MTTRFCQAQYLLLCPVDINMAEELKVKLIFPNDDPVIEIDVGLNSTFQEIKKNITENHWPDNYHPDKTLERLRLFAHGKELGGKNGGEQKSFRDMKLPAASGSMPVLVFPVWKTSESAADDSETAKPTQCSCAIL